MRRTLWLIAKKELLDTLRDRRTLFVALLLPILLYPALLLGLTQVIGATQRNLREERQHVIVDGVDSGGQLSFILAKGLVLRVLGPNDRDVAEELRRLAGRLGGGEEVLDGSSNEGSAATAASGEDSARRELRTLLNDHNVVGAVLAERLDGGDAYERRSEVELVFDVTDDASKTARDKVRRALREFAENQRTRIKERYPDDRARLEFVEKPVEVREIEIASKRQKGAYSFAPMLALLIVLMCLTGAFYPAVDLAAGEKERGTMETLLVTPARRSEIVLGKFVAIWIVAVVTALLNLAVMGLTFSKLAGMLAADSIAFAIPIWALLSVTVILIPTAALFSAVALAVSSFATSYKEGQHYLSPLFLVVLPLAMVAILPNVRLGPALALLPVANVVLLVKAMLLGGEEARYAFLATAAMVVYAGVALKITVSIFQRESVLFRAGGGTGHDAVSLEARRRGVPTSGLAVVLFFIVLALMFYLAGKPPSDLSGVVWVFILTQGVAVLMPTLLLARLKKLNFKETFALRPIKPLLFPVLVCAALCTLILVLGLQTRFLKPPEAKGFMRVVELIAGGPLLLTLVLLAVLPPVCEELLCRGFLLSGLRGRYGGARAVLLSAVLFGVLHLDLYRFPATFLAGLMLGFILVRTRSVFACILFHAVYNSILALTLHIGWLTWKLENMGAPAFALAAVGLVACVAFLSFDSRRERT